MEAAVPLLVRLRARLQTERFRSSDLIHGRSVCGLALVVDLCTRKAWIWSTSSDLSILRPSSTRARTFGSASSDAKTAARAGTRHPMPCASKWPAIIAAAPSSPHLCSHAAIGSTIAHASYQLPSPTTASRAALPTMGASAGKRDGSQTGIVEPPLREVDELFREVDEPRIGHARRSRSRCQQHRQCEWVVGVETHTLVREFERPIDVAAQVEFPARDRPRDVRARIEIECVDRPFTELLNQAERRVSPEVFEQRAAARAIVRRNRPVHRGPEVGPFGCEGGGRQLVGCGEAVSVGGGLGDASVVPEVAMAELAEVVEFHLGLAELP